MNDYSFKILRKFIAWDEKIIDIPADNEKQALDSLLVHMKTDKYIEYNSYDYDVLSETIVPMTLNQNDNASTLMIENEDGEIVYQNGD